MDGQMWEELHAHFSDPELVELGLKLAESAGGQRWVRVLEMEHRELLGETTGGLAPALRTERQEAGERHRSSGDLPRAIASLDLSKSRNGHGAAAPSISPLPPSQIKDPEIRELFELARREGTPGVEFLEVVARLPDVMKLWAQHRRAQFQEGVVEHTLKELQRLRVAQVLGCDYSAVERSKLALDQGLTEEKIQALADYEHSPLFTHSERLALRLTDAITSDPLLADDELWEELHRAFTEPQILELGERACSSGGSQRWIMTLNLRHADRAT